MKLMIHNSINLHKINNLRVFPFREGHVCSYEQDGNTYWVEVIEYSKGVYYYVLPSYIESGPRYDDFYELGPSEAYDLFTSGF